MAKKRLGKYAKIQEEIESLKARKRLDIIKIVAAVTAVLVLMWLDTLFGATIAEVWGTTVAMVKSALLWISAIVLAAFAGLAARDYSRCSRSLADARQRAAKFK